MPELSKITGSPSTRSSSPTKVMQRAGRMPPGPQTRLFTVSIENRLLEEPQSALLSQQCHHLSPRLPPPAKGDDMSLHSAGPASAKYCILANGSAISAQPATKGELLPPADTSKTQGASQWTVADVAKVVDGTEPTRPLLREAEVLRPHPSSLKAKGESCSPASLPSPGKLKPVKGLFSSKMVQESSSEEAPTDVTGQFAFGHLMIAKVEHPKELFPQSALQKKIPVEVQALCPCPREATHAAANSSSPFLAALLPVAHSGSATASRGSKQAHGDARSDEGLPCAQVAADGPTEDVKPYLRNELAQPEKAEGQVELANTRQSISSLSKERTSNGNSRRTLPSRRLPDDFAMKEEQKEQMKQGRRAVCKGAEHAAEPNLRSRTVAASPTGSSALKKNASGRREPTTVEKKARKKGG
ncbi:hypothetical protein Emag_000968 [Eimeria magna]